MTKEQKDLLLKDISARLPYKVKAQIPDEYGGYTSAIENIDIDGFVVDFEGTQIEVEYIKPYLFPMSSMTKEQEAEWYDRYITPLCERMKPHTRKEDLMLSAKTHYVSIFWLLENHFDYLGLIEMGLALDATGKNIY